MDRRPLHVMIRRARRFVRSNRLALIFLLVLALAAGVIGGYFIWRSVTANKIHAGDTAVGIDSEAFSCDGQRIDPDITFTLIYARCRDQIRDEIGFLADHHIRLIRIWPIVSQFFVVSHVPLVYGNLNQQYLANLDDFLGLLADHNMHAILTLNTQG